METGSFYGVTLNEKEPLAQFEVDEEDMNDQKLIVKQICLGMGAKDGEYNVIQAETRVGDNETLKIPIAVLKAGETRVLRPMVEFPSASVTFKLIHGTGPVYICGEHIVTEGQVEDWYNHNEEGDEDEYDDETSPPQTNGKNSNNKKK